MASQCSNVNISRAVKSTLNDLNEHLHFAVFETTSFTSSMLPSADDKILSAHLNLLEYKRKKVFVIIACWLRTTGKSLHAMPL